MKQVKFGSSDWNVSAVALGIMRMATLDTKKAAKALIAAKEAGINFIDSADLYGNGKSEDVFNKAMKEAGLTRDDFYLQSKAGIVFDEVRSNGDLVFGKRYDFSKEHILTAVDGILKRFDTDYLDSFLLHRPDPLMEVDEVAEAFDKLQQSGKVRHFGVSNFNPQQVELLQSAVNQKLLANQVQFSVAHTGMIDFGMHVNRQDDGAINRDGGLIEYSRRKQMTLQAWSPLQYGMFAGTFIGSPEFEPLNEKLQELADKYGVSKNAIAISWITRHPADMQVIIGTMTPKHITDSAAGADVVLTRQEWYDLYFAAGNDLP